ncbi:MAG: cytochrome-c peroxidase, partial [Gammaproteobacteria bacterium]|nr:cytochrome-c peroxidase [Gammaproteobacteria bacterium]
MKKVIWPLAFFLGISLPVWADQISETRLDHQLRQIIQTKKLSGRPALNKSIYPISSPMAQLGKRLFFSTLLGGKTDTACASCHHPLLGGGDSLSLSIGVDAVDPQILGPKRRHSPEGFDFDGGPTVARNSPSTFNSVFYSRCMFWDCRIESLGATPGMNGSDDSIIRTPDTMWGMPRIRTSSLLQAQVAFPVIATNEMRAKFKEDEDHNELRGDLASRIKKQSKLWLTDFQQAFNSKADTQQIITFENISFAIAAYEASQIFVNNPWQAYIKGNNEAISDKAKQGALLFFQSAEQGGYGCSNCHSGDFFTNEKAYVTAIPQIGRGKDDGFDKSHDYGRYVETGNPD